MLNPEMECALPAIWLGSSRERSPSDAPEVMLVQNLLGESLHIRKVTGEWWLAGWLDGIIPPLDRGP